jgi:hypothetical protein
LVISRFSPVASTVATATGVKMGSRLGKTIKSFGRGSFANPVF